MKTARLLILLFPLLSAVLFCQAKRMGSEKGLMSDGASYYYDYDDYKQTIFPLYVKNDSIVFADLKYSVHSVKDLYIPYIDIIVDKELSDIILSKESDKKWPDDSPWSNVFSYAYYYYQVSGVVFGDKGDGCAKKVREVAPHGYITKWSWSRNSVDGISPKVEFYNASNKTIKYITFYYTFDNAVGDPCYGLTVKKLIPFSCIGPVEEGCTDSWDADGDPVDYVANAETGKIVKCKIEYMDGTSYVLIKELVFGN